MEKLLIIYTLFTTCFSYSLEVSNASLNSTSGGAFKRDVSFSYAATDIASHDGVHVKTITVIKNVADKPKKVDSVVKLSEITSGSDDLNNKEEHKLEVIPHISEELFSEFNVFLNNEYGTKPNEKNEDNKKEINSETDKTEEENINVEFNTYKEQLTNEGVFAGDDLLNVNAEKIIETNENVTCEKLKPSDEKYFISSPILPEQAKRSAKAQKDRYQTNLVKSSDQPQPKELFNPATNIEEHSENKKLEPPFEKLFEPSNVGKSEPLLQIPFSTNNKTVFSTNTTYNKKTFQPSASPKLGYKRDNIFIPKFSNSNYKPIKK